MVEPEEIAYSVKRPDGAVPRSSEGVAERQSLGGLHAPKRHHLRVDRDLQQGSSWVGRRYVRAELPKVLPFRSFSIVQVVVVLPTAAEDRRVQTDAGLRKNCRRGLSWLEQPVAGPEREGREIRAADEAPEILDGLRNNAGNPRRRQFTEIVFAIVQNPIPALPTGVTPLGMKMETDFEVGPIQIPNLLFHQADHGIGPASLDAR